QKNIKGRAVHNLRVEIPRRTQRQKDLVSRLTLKLLNDFFNCKIQVGSCGDVDLLRPHGHCRKDAKKTKQPSHSSPKNTQQTSAPITLMERPQIISLLNKAFRFSDTAAFAMHSAPSVESGETSTRCAPTFTDDAIAIASPPPISRINPGMVGMKAGSTTPEELL